MERVGRWERNGGTFWEIHYDPVSFSVRTLYVTNNELPRFNGNTQIFLQNRWSLA